MKRGLLIPFGAGLVLVAVAIGMVFYAQRGEHLQPDGTVLKFRSVELDAKSSLLVLDVRVLNDSDVAITVRNLEMSVDTADGQTVEGTVLSPGDLKSAFEYHPLLGEQFNPPLAIRGIVAPRAKADHMVAASFPLSLAALDARKRVLLRMEDQSGPVAEISGK